MRGQVSVEFLMITGIAVFVLAGASFFMFNFISGADDKNAMSHVATVGYNVVEQARNMYVYGEGSYVSVDASMPEQIKSIYIVEEDALVFVLVTSRGEVSVPVFSEVPINGTLEIGPKVYVPNATQTAHPGPTRYRVESKGSYVLIRQIS